MADGSSRSARSAVSSWLADPRFIIGALLFVIGFWTHYRSDEILRSLRETDRGYQIPRGGLYRFISCPNYFGEIVEWTGFAIATWSLPGSPSHFGPWPTLPRARSPIIDGINRRFRITLPKKSPLSFYPLI